MIYLVGVLASLILAAPAYSTVIFSDTFESHSAGEIDCATPTPPTGYYTCNESVSPAEGPAELSFVSSIPGFSGSFPSGSQALRVHADGRSIQAEADLDIKDPNSSSNDNWIPADAWFQFVLYPNYSGSEQSLTNGRTMKLWYPCKGPYPCSAGTGGNFYLLELGVNAYMPFGTVPSSNPSSGNLYLATQAHTLGTACWSGAEFLPGWGASDCGKLGQTSLADWIKPNRWNVLRCHQDFRNTAAASLECWVGPLGGTLTKIMNWVGGTTIEGYSFSWTIPSATGHRTALFPSSSVPANAAAGPEFWLYMDDLYIATSEADLPTYTASTTGSVVGVGGIRFSGSVRIQ